MKQIRILLIACCLAAVATHNAALAQQADEQLAAYYYNNGEYEQAAQLYESLYPSPKGNRYYYQRLLSTYLHLQRYKDAQHIVSARKKAMPAELYLFVDEGNIYLQQKQDKKALRCFDKAIEAIGINQQPVAELAQAFVGIGRHDYAARTYLAARKATGNKYLYFNELCTVYQSVGNYTGMTAEYFDLLDNQPSMLQSVQVSMQKALAQAADSRLAEGIRRELVSRVQRQPDNQTYLRMLVWFAMQQNDYAFALEQAQAIDARGVEIGSQQVLQVAQIAEQNGALDVAAQGYNYLLHKGKENPFYMQARVGALQVDYARIEASETTDSNAVAQLGASYLAALSELGKNLQTIPLMRNYAKLMAYKGGRLQAAVDMLDDILALPKLNHSTRDEVKLQLGDLLLFAGQTWDASLLYMQVEKANKDDVIGATAKFSNARLSYFNHDFDWANSQLRTLRSSTSKLIANDAMELSLLISDNMEDDSTYTMLELFANADLLLYRGMLDSALAVYDQITQQVLSHPLFDEILMRKATIRVKQARYAEADSLLQRLLTLYPYEITADDALMLRAEINEQHLGNTTRAIECYEQLLIDYPSSLYNDRARKRYNALKNTK